MNKQKDNESKDISMIKWMIYDFAGLGREIEGTKTFTSEQAKTVERLKVVQHIIWTAYVCIGVLAIVLSLKAGEVVYAAASLIAVPIPPIMARRNKRRLQEIDDKLREMESSEREEDENTEQ